MFIGKKLCKNKVCGMNSVISLPVGDEVKVTQKGDDGHSSAIINSASTVQMVEETNYVQYCRRSQSS